MAFSSKMGHLRAEGQEGEWPGSVNKEEGGPLPYLQAWWYCVCWWGGSDHDSRGLPQK